MKVSRVVLLALLQQLLPRGVEAQTFCTLDEVLVDSCESTEDNVCDVDTEVCGAGTDCYDCDPCKEFEFDCSACTSNGCSFCPGNGQCASAEYAEGKASSCESAGSAFDANGQNCTALTCDFSGGDLEDSCPSANDGSCDTESLCPFGTDCFDCDTLQEYDFVSCEACIGAGGAWCGKDTRCSDPLLAIFAGEYNGEMHTCTQEDYAYTTEDCARVNSGNLYPDPLYSGLSWVYELINVEPVWRNGISTYLTRNLSSS